ncbi:MAG: N-acetyltransferase [Rhodospirillaceae bacterium]|nr:N-acetyltransferase [Rhodospirillaceae bacterium]
MLELTLKTARLVLRPFRLSDGPRIQALVGVWNVAKMLGSVPHPYPNGHAEQWIARHDGLRAAGRGYPFAVTQDGALIGSAGVDRRKDHVLELGYWIGMPYWGRGLASEAARAVVDFAFGWLAAPRVVAGFMDENAASARILAKIGFVPAGSESRDSKSRCGTVNCNMLVLTEDAWAEKRV